ncbi:uncharacterized protein LOC116570965 [Mustela erminea]|uniref:uncharacterized protein LOC116570965 n=1 Tax=Mustela erminea TaxID=36723 RepID=UPI00138678AD|nr:uncharacterized protein LOC116570965 [Mustela erminea]
MSKIGRRRDDWPGCLRRWLRGLAGAVQMEKLRDISCSVGDAELTHPSIQLVINFFLSIYSTPDTARCWLNSAEQGARHSGVWPRGSRRIQTNTIGLWEECTILAQSGKAAWVRRHVNWTAREDQDLHGLRRGSHMDMSSGPLHQPPSKPHQQGPIDGPPSWSPCHRIRSSPATTFSTPYLFLCPRAGSPDGEILRSGTAVSKGTRT